MGVPTTEVGYTSATTGRGDHEVHKGHGVALGEIDIYINSTNLTTKIGSSIYIKCTTEANN
jgi:hypothetical protein